MRSIHHLFLALSKVLIVLLGSIVVYLSFSGYRRNGGKSLLMLSVGFFLIVVASLVAGLLFEFIGMELHDSYAIDSLITAAGFFSIIYSIYGTRS